MRSGRFLSISPASCCRLVKRPPVLPMNVDTATQVALQSRYSQPWFPKQRPRGQIGGQWQTRPNASRDRPTQSLRVHHHEVPGGPCHDEESVERGQGVGYQNTGRSARLEDVQGFLISVEEVVDNPHQSRPIHQALHPPWQPYLPDSNHRRFPPEARQPTRLPYSPATSMPSASAQSRSRSRASSSV